ncbi:PleD family two-component system response regulator, partial [Thermodesulfobacteriota bacterium]
FWHRFCVIIKVLTLFIVKIFLRDHKMKKIFIVDNDMIFLKLITKFLEDEGHRVKTAIDGLNALDVLKNYTPDVLFIDLVMPNIDGETLCRIIRGMEKFKDAYLIILSAISAEEYVDCQLGGKRMHRQGPVQGNVTAHSGRPRATRVHFFRVLGGESPWH